VKKLSNSNIYVILTYLICGVIIFTSLLINIDKYLYFISSLIIGTLIIVIYINKFIKIQKKHKIIFWLYYIVSVVTLFGFLLTKKFIYTSLLSDAPRGYTGRTGNMGDSGTSYFLETYQERFYNDLINNIELYLNDVLNETNSKFNRNNKLFNNYFIKEKIKKICTSKELFNALHKSSLNDIENNQNNPNIYYSEDDYKQILNKLNTIIVENPNLTLNKSNGEFNNKPSWIQTIMRNNCKEDLKLKQKLKLKFNENLYTILQNSKQLYNNNNGFRFLNSDLEIEKYYDNLIIKNNINPMTYLKINSKLWNGDKSEI
tara:strand:- start:85 stop:1032 length:948 start_codon:yes stop_codon:yes gene_type:complete